jgi:hypothetical protein
MAISLSDDLSLFCVIPAARNAEGRVTNYVSCLEEAVQLSDKRKIYEDSINSLWRLVRK